jgi:ferredoxin
MQSEAELTVNVDLVNGLEPDIVSLEKSQRKPRSLHIESYCTACGECIKRCKAEALSITAGELKLEKDKCILCSYCALACSNFALKVL